MLPYKYTIQSYNQMTKLSPHLPIPHPTNTQLELSWLECLQSCIFRLQPHPPRPHPPRPMVVAARAICNGRLSPGEAVAASRLWNTKSSSHRSRHASISTAFRSRTLPIPYLLTKGKKTYSPLQRCFGGSALKTTMHHVVLQHYLFSGVLEKR